MSIPSQEVSRQVVVVTQTKSVGIAILLTLFLGPVGLFYASVLGALVILLGVPVAFAVIAAVLMAKGSAVAAILLIPGAVAVMWIGALVWSVVAVNAYNRGLANPRA